VTVEGVTTPRKSAPGNRKYVESSSPEVEDWPPCRFPSDDEGTLVESEALVRAFSPGSTLEPGLKAFHRRGLK
jgi:hypothetical protein